MFRGIGWVGIVALVSVATVGVASAQSPSPSAKASFPVTWQVTNQRAVAIENVRLISMSPDGSLIVGARPAIGYRRGDLCVFRVDTFTEQACADISGLEAGIRLEDVTWSPDGSKLAFTEEAFQVFKDGDLWLMDTTTGSLTNLDDDGSSGTLPVLRPKDATGLVTIPVSPTFTPDGQSVTFSRSFIQDGERAGNEIATVQLSGGTPKRLVVVDTREPGVAYFGMRWAPNGRHLYYSVHHVDPNDTRNGIWAVAADGSGARRVTGGTNPDDGAPAVIQVSATNVQLLAYYPLAANQFTGTHDVYAIVDAVSGTEQRLVAPAVTEPAAAFIVEVGFSPDGAGILEVVRNSDPNNQVLVRDVASGAHTTIVPDGLPQAGPIANGLVATWAIVGTSFISGGGALDRGTLLTIDGGPAPAG